MLKLSALTTIAFLLLSCNNSTVQDKNVDKQETTTTSSNASKSNPITIEYSNEINGYKVTVLWLLENVTENDADGPAILAFKDVKTNSVYYATQHHFSETIDKDNLKFIKFKNAGDTKEFVGNESFKQTVKYVLPKVGKTEFLVEGYEDYIPFFFKDVDFDNNAELILVDSRFSEKGGCSNQVYDLGEGYERTIAPFNDFNNFYMNAGGEGAAYNLTTIDYKTKTITQSYITGASTGGEDIYKYNPVSSTVELVSKSVTDWVENGNGEVITTVTDKNGKVIKVTKSGQ